MLALVKSIPGNVSPESMPGSGRIADDDRFASHVSLSSVDCRRARVRTFTEIHSRTGTPCRGSPSAEPIGIPALTTANAASYA